ncbi:MAG: DUF885 family protein, partial [Daejeonella sp.]
MKKNILLIFTLLFSALLFNACTQNAPVASSVTDSTKNISQVFDTYWEENAKLFPLDATSQGDNRYNNILNNDATQSFRDSLKNFYQKYLNEITAFDREKLDENDKISYDIFKYEMESKLKGLTLNTWMIPTQQFWGLPITMGQLGSGEGNQPFKTIEDYENWLGRVKSYS